MALVFRAEALEGGFAPRGGAPAALTRWEIEEIGVRLEGGAPEDHEAAREILARLSKLTGRRFQEGGRHENGAPDLRIRFLAPAARRAEGAAAQDFRALRRLWAEDEAVFCLALGETDDDGALKRAEVLVKSEASPERRRSCLIEETAQAMGLFNDATTRGASVFNDDDRYAELTAQDEDLLRLLYDPRLTPGLTAEQAAPLVRAIAVEMARSAATKGRRP